ncbi:MAG: type VII secretion integral membrane protein EccD [Pseudonocardiales bacterium]|nr:type VII secretion integral membrane protein EccD [Pseudonocardiales bacterium]
MVFSRVTVVAPRTRIDVALPADVEVANLLPMLLTMAGESGPDGGSEHGGWCLAKLGGEGIDPDLSLSALGVLDGDLLQLRRRSDTPPLPLFDDVVEAIAVAAPDSYRPWTPSTARTLGMVGAGLALLASAVALFLAGILFRPGAQVEHGHTTLAVLAGIAAMVMLIIGTVVAQVYGEVSVGVLIAAGSLPLSVVCGLSALPGGMLSHVSAGELAPNLLLACTLTFVFAAASIILLGAGITPFTAAATAAALGALVFLTDVLIRKSLPAAGIAAGAAAVALGSISALPRLAIEFSRLPKPQVPSSAQDLREDPSFPDYTAIERQTGLAHQYLTGMIMGSGGVAAIGAVLAAVQDRGVTSPWGIGLGVVVAAVLLLRARSYPNANQASALLVSGMVAVAGLIAALLMKPGLLWVGFGALLVLAMLALVAGVVLPRRRFSPVLRRSVDVLEAVLIAAVLPLTLGVLGLYQHLHSR